MFSDNEIEQYLTKSRVSTKAKTYIRDTRRTDPARLVGTTAHTNQCTWFVSRKMRRTIQSESRTAEYGYVVEFEYSDEIHEFWDQPAPITVERTYKNGHRRRGSYTPDFLVLHRNGPQVVEVKTAEEIRRRIELNPIDWVETKDGVCYRPAQSVFSEIGLEYRVCSSEDLNPVRTANFSLLLQARYRPDESIEYLSAISNALNAQSWMTIEELARQVGMSELTPIIQMIASRKLFVDVDHELISRPESTRVFGSYDVFLYITQDASLNVSCVIDDVAVDRVPTKKQAEQALERLRRVHSGENSRSVRRWKNLIKTGAEQGLSEFQSVIPKTHRSGNRRPRLNPRCVEFLKKFIYEEYASHRRLTKYRAYLLYYASAQECHPDIPPVSRPTFEKYIKASDPQKIAAGRGGRRAANAARAPVNIEDRELRATLPFEKALMDHYLMDLSCVLARANGEKYLARPWITVIIDQYTRSVLGLWMGFRSPSTTSCAMAIRDCVRAYGKLPKSISVDRGAEFTSVYFSTLMAHCGVDLIVRPASHPRSGSEVERFFGEFKSRWLNMRPGNLAEYNEARSVSGSHAPYKNASLTIEDALTELREYIDWRNDTLIGVRSESADFLLKNRQKQFPFVGVPVNFDDAFKVLSAVDVRKYKVDPLRGVNIQGQYFWHPGLSGFSTRERVVTVRIEPENPYQVYALIGQSWTVLRANSDRIFKTDSLLHQRAEAIRVLDGRKSRARAKFEADIELARKIQNADSRQSKERSDAPVEKSIKYSVKNDSSSVFKRLANDDAQPLKTQKWGDL